MKRKLLKQTISQWRSNSWLIVELVIIMVVTWFLVDLLCQVYVPMAEPKGFDTDHCYKLYLRTTDEVPEDSTISLSDVKNELISRLRHYPGVEGVAISLQGVEPYTGNMVAGDVRDVTTADTLTFGRIRIGYTNADFLRVFRIKGAGGQCPDSLVHPFVHGGGLLLSSNVFEFVDSGCPVPSYESVAGHRFNVDGYDLRLAAVIENVKRDEFTPSARYGIALIFFPETADNMKLVDMWTDVTIRVRPEAENGFMERFRKDMGVHFRLPGIYVYNIVPFDKVRKTDMESGFKTVGKMYIVIGFLLVNVFLGLFGTFWYRTRRRSSELAVRMSFGASRISLFRRLMGEGIILLVFASLISVPLLWLLLYMEVRPNVYGFMDIEAVWIVRDSVITFFVLLMIICLGISFPAWAAMKVDPATALHDE